MPATLGDGSETGSVEGDVFSDDVEADSVVAGKTGLASNVITGGAVFFASPEAVIEEV